MNKINIIQELEQKLNHEDYMSNYFANLGIKEFFVGKNTLGPEMSWVAQHLTEFLINNSNLYKGKVVLDMGAGTGIQGLVSAIKGAKQVTFTDISDDAIRSIKKNIELFNLNNAKYVKSDLFSKLESIKFDVVIINHPFLSSTPINNKEKIYKIEDSKLKEFFEEVPNYIKEEGILIMPFSDFTDQDPGLYARELGYPILRKKRVSNKYGEHFIYIIKPKR